MTRLAKRPQKKTGRGPSKELVHLFKQLRQEITKRDTSFDSESISRLMNEIHKSSGNEEMKLIEKDRVLIFLINSLIQDTMVVMGNFWDLWKDLLLSLITIEWILMELKGVNLPLPKLPEPWPPRPGSKGKG